MPRISPVLLLPITLPLLGCGAREPLAPVTSGLETGLHPFVLKSQTDPRLPAPMAEADGETLTKADETGPAEDARGRPPAPADPASFWNQRVTALGIGAKLSPPLMARAYALTHVAVFDALVAAHDSRRGHLPANAVAAGAAAVVLDDLFPAQAAETDAAAAAQAGLRRAHERHRTARAWALGRKVGKLAVEHGRADGSDAVFPGPAPSGECVWTGTNPVLPMCGTWKTWVTSSGGEFQPDPPYACGTMQDIADVQAVIDAMINRTPEQIAIVHKWADQPPPTVWNGLLLPRVAAHRLRPLASARAFAYVNVAMYDAFVACWRTKYTYWTSRPFQRIPGLVTVVPTPNFPTYTSGHSTISGAAARVMGQLFRNERAFFEAQAEEAAMSRLWAGIHFPHDNAQGLLCGHQVGDKVVLRMKDDDDDEELLADAD